MSKNKYCDEHEHRLDETGVNRFYFDSALIFWIFNNRIDWLAHTESCFLCMCGEDRLIACLKEAADMDAGVRAGGGTLTTDKMSIFAGGTDDE